MEGKNLKQSLEIFLKDFLLKSPLNEVKELGSIKIFDEPLFGYASVSDPLFEFLKEETVVGAHHKTPGEWMETGNTVISYFLPLSYKVREANRKMGMPAKEWLYGRIEGEKLNVEIRKQLVSWFIEQGYEAMSPGLDQRLTQVNQRSNWSERHAAYIAGLGTFSLNASLITKKGAAGRIGSLIVSASLEPTHRPYTKKDEYCTYCGACIFRCPPMAISEDGKNHKVCSEYLDRVLERFNPRYGCGKCQTAVPCEDKIPQK